MDDNTLARIEQRIERLERITLATTTTAIGELEVISTEARQQLADRLADDLRAIAEGLRSIERERMVNPHA